MPLVSFSHYEEKCFYVDPTLPNCAIIFSDTRGQTKNAILYIIKKKRVGIIYYFLMKIKARRFFWIIFVIIYYRYFGKPVTIFKIITI